MKVLFTLLLTMIITLPAAGQNFLLDNEKSSVLILGTSTVHDWESVAEDNSGTAMLRVEDNMLVTIDNLSFTAMVKGIKSGKRKMDSKTYDAFDAKKNPEITFNFQELTNITEDSLSAKGTLSMAGESRPVEMMVGWSLEGPDTVVFSGVYTVSMPEYKMKPPTAVFGTIKTGEDVRVEFRTAFTRN